MSYSSERKKRKKHSITSNNNITLENDELNNSIETDQNHDKNCVKEHKKKRSKLSLTHSNDITTESDCNTTLIETEGNQGESPSKEHKKKRGKLSLTLSNGITTESDCNTTLIETVGNQAESPRKEHKKKRRSLTTTFSNDKTVENDNNITLIEAEKNQDESPVNERKKKRSKLSLTPMNGITLENDNNVTSIETKGNQNESPVKEHKRKRSKLSLTPINGITPESDNNTTSIETERNQNESPVKEHKKKRSKLSLTPMDGITTESDYNTTSIETERNQNESPVKEHKKKRSKLSLTPMNGITTESDNNTTFIEAETNQNESPVKKHKKKRSKLSLTPMNGITTESDNNTTLIEAETNQDESISQSKKKRRKLSITPNDITVENDNNVSPIETEENQDKSPVKEPKKKRSKLSITPTNDITKENDNNTTLIDTKENQDKSPVKEPKKKRSKLSITSTNDVTIENDNNTSIEDEEEEDENSEKKSGKINVKGLSGKYFRKAFVSPHGFDELKTFVTVCTENKKKDLASEYLSAGGNILEVLRLLDSSDKKNTTKASVVFSAINILIMKILADFPQYLSSAEEACRHFINSHMSSVHSMLSAQSSAKQRKVVLKLLTAIVSLGGALPRELIAHLPVQPKAIEMLVQHAKPSDSQNVRTCYIHFILSFLIEGNVAVIRSLIDKREVLTSIFPGLIYDKQEIINLLLVSLKKYILENPGISKTLKLYVFSTPVVQSLISLYNWKGPTNWSRGKSSKTAITNVPADQKELVTDILHDFLITLLTSHRHGIIFHDRTIGTSREKHNQLINTVLESLERPWEYAKPSDLIVKIMACCPSLIRSQLLYLESYLEPRLSKKWITVMTFIKQIIETVDMDVCIKTCSPELNTVQLTNAIGSLCVSPFLIKTVIIPSLNHSSIIIRHEAIELLFCMINQMKKYLLAAKFYNKNDLEVKSSVTDYIVKTVPNLNIILKVWTDAFVINKDTNNLSEDNSLSEPSKQNHFSTILNVLHTYNDICPELLNTTLDVEPNLLFSGLNDLYDIDDEELIILRIKAIQFLLVLNSSEFTPSKTAFAEIFEFLSFLLNENSSVICSYAKTTTKTLLNITGLFDECHEQLDIWINGLCNVNNSEEKTELVNWLIKIIKNTIKHMDKYVNMISTAKEVANDGIANDNELSNTINESHSIEDRKNIEQLYMQSDTSILPILCCAINKLKGNSTFAITQYMSYVLVHTLHYQVNPGPLISLITDIQDLEGGKYLLSWCSDNNPTSLPKIFSSMNTMHKLSKALLKDSTIKLNELFTGDIKLTFNYDNEEIIINHALSTYEIMILLKMTIFYLTHDIRKNDFNQMKFNNYKRMIMCLLNIANTIQDEDSSMFVKSFVKTIFSHPIILQYFFFHQDDNTIEIAITNLILDICQIVMNVYNLTITDLLTPYKNKAIIQIEKIANEKTHQYNSMYKTIITLLEQLQFTAQDIVHLFMVLTKLAKIKFMLKDTSNLSMCGYIFPKLLQLLCNENIRCVQSEVSKLDIQFVKKAFTCMIFLKQQNISDVNLWETALQEYLQHFPHNIAAINTNTFKSILKQSVDNKNAKLISFLLNKNMKLLSTFIKYVLELENMKEHTYLLSVIENNLKYTWKEDLIKKLSDSYKDEILHYILHPAESKNWIEENVNVICYIIDKTFDLEKCNEVCNTILQIGDQLEMVHTCYIHILKSLYYKYAQLEENRNIQIIMNLVQILVHIITLTLKKESKNIDKVILLCEKLNDTINYLKEKKNDFIFEDLSMSHSWPQFTRFSLKIGFTLTKDNKTYLPIIKTLGTLCDVICKNDSNNEYAKTIFEMTTSHSEFVNTMLMTSSTVKRDVVQLLWILIQKNKSLMKSSHIPLYLSAYGATLSETDQLILLILQYYERNKIKIHEYRPYLWGNAAAIHYSVKGDVSTAIWRQPSTYEVLGLFEQEIVENTIKYYPVNRSLESSELYNAGDIYDPAFYLPLLCYLLSDNNIVACYKITQSGALALILIACSSNHSEIRMAAYTAIARYYFHLESSSFKEKVLWMRLVDSLRNGILTTKNNLQDMHIISLVSTFLARTSIVATQPLHPLYLPLHNFLMVKPALDLNTVPELLQLFHSSDVNHKEHRHWILETIRDGIKTEKDVEVACKCMLYKMLLDFFTCLLSDTKTKKLILEVIESSTKIPKSCLLLIRGYGLLCWLTETVLRLKHCDAQWVTLIINIVSNILKTLLGVKKEYDFYKILLLKILLSLQKHLTLGISISSFEQYLNLLQTLLASNDLKNVISKEDMESIVDFSKNLIGKIDECENMLNHGCKFVNKAEHSNMNENELEKTRKSMQALVWTWFRYGVR
ncbi:PREDICTED: nucleolar pre-ribosomal-associated protein 1 isoform X2 [Polistes dominula]|nr:PREDICTED: nucleolar pre-ribosomal-associated protein 1 isoform X2 [Polistes dominula]XP_015175564.1 PREDICTED: nucleolar pre-ribosomal-associated protein 1 isoform X2 [Polistes dominula]